MTLQILQQLSEGGFGATEEEQFMLFQQCFDEVIERLPACGPLLAQIKVLR